MLVRQIADLVGGGQPRSESPRTRKVLARRELDVVPLPVAHGGLVEAGIARHVPDRLLGRDGAARPADDHRKLALIVQVGRDLRPDDRGSVRHQGIGEADENRRMVGLGPAGLLTVRLIVQADADDLARVGDHRQQGQAGKVEPLPVRKVWQRSGGDGGPEVVRAGQLDDALTLDAAEGGPSPRRQEARISHRAPRGPPDARGSGSHARRNRKVRSARPRAATSLSERPHWSMRPSGHDQSSGAPTL